MIPEDEWDAWWGGVNDLPDDEPEDEIFVPKDES